ncbi:DEAD/DEAH box helicase [Salinarimonas soli]|uniref:DEAD/DEAH box helicase n=1 Tax=Salinarimonas soli TaxID=1638099 RepID=A0A5B2VNL2_9HYPH|nr:DEAD/DEAH box helicase [Salinarimonas soli]
MLRGFPGIHSRRGRRGTRARSLDGWRSRSSGRLPGPDRPDHRGDRRRPPCGPRRWNRPGDPPRASRHPVYAGWREIIGPLPAAAELGWACLKRPSPERGFSEAFLIRMLFSCLVDADFLETEAFYARAEGRDPGRTGFSDLTTLRGRLARFMEERETQAEAGDLNLLRARVRAHVVAMAALGPGLFTLTVPTGGGKTLTSLSFALEHAVRHGLERVAYVIPFTSIIEQTAEVFRGALAADPGGRNDDDILEHHATFDWDAARDRREDGRGDAPADRLRRAAENWAAPIVVTTAVQFFESLFANRTSRCRKLHNLAKSVIVLDEAQTMPLAPMRRPPRPRPSATAPPSTGCSTAAALTACGAASATPPWRSGPIPRPASTRRRPGARRRPSPSSPSRPTRRTPTTTRKKPPRSTTPSTRWRPGGRSRISASASSRAPASTCSGWRRTRPACPSVTGSTTTSRPSPAASPITGATCASSPRPTAGAPSRPPWGVSSSGPRRCRRSSTTSRPCSRAR